MRHLILLTILMALSACGYTKKPKKMSSAHENQIIYGDDGRKDYFEVSDLKLLTMARSTVALIDIQNLKYQPQNGVYNFVGNIEFQMCLTEKFLNQPKIAFCSGTLIAPDLVLTAGHCIENAKDCNSTRLVFDYKLLNARSQISSVPAENVFKCAEIIQTTQSKNAADFAIIRLEKVAIGREPMQFSDRELTSHDSLMLIGHPAGLPTKFTMNGQVRNLIPDEYFTASLDSFSGNSGSAVFDQSTGLIVGVLSRGGQDYERKNSCYVAKACAENDCRGEDVTRALVVKKYLPGH